LGIVTWATIRCQLLPKIHKLFFIPAGDLRELTDCAYRLLRLRLGDEFLIVNNTTLALLIGKEAGDISALKEKLPPWTIVIGIAGRDILPEEKVEVQEKDIRETAQQFALQLVSEIPGTTSRQVLDLLVRTSETPYWKLRYKGGCQDIFFLSTLEKTPELIGTMYTRAEALGYPGSDIGVYIQPQHQGVSHHCEFNLPYDPSDEKERGRIRELFVNASEELMKQGAYFSRPYGMWADMVYGRDVQTTSMLKGIKDIFDPNHVLNPGKLCF
jgi:hypothetical protein